MFNTIGLVVAAAAVAIAGVLGVAATKPDTFRFERSTRIQAPPETIYALIEDFRQWALWSPFEKLDLTMKKTYGGAPKGQGATYAWEGNGKAGVGRMEILNATVPTLVTIRLDFTKPFPASNIAEFTLVPDGDATLVTWAMTGPNKFINKLFSVVINMDQMIGKAFESGLAELKAIAEKPPVAAS